MMGARGTLVGAALVLSMTGIVWIVNDDRFGRPAATPHSAQPRPDRAAMAALASSLKL